MTRKFTLREFSSGAKLLQSIIDRDYLDCVRIMNDTESGEIIHLLKMLGDEQYAHLESDIRSAIRRTSLNLLRRQGR